MKKKEELPKFSTLFIPFNVFEIKDPIPPNVNKPEKLLKGKKITLSEFYQFKLGSLKFQKLVKV